MEFHGLRAGVIGTGFIGPVHIEALKRNGIQVTAICGGERARKVAAKWNIPQVFTDYDHEALVNSPEVDVVHITSPNKDHYPQSIAALKAGKHVVCEKPLAMTAKGDSGDREAGREVAEADLRGELQCAV